MRHIPNKVLNVITVVFTALIFFSLSYLTAKWFFLDSGITSDSTVTMDILAGTLTFLGGAIPAALILSFFDKKRALQLAIISGPVAFLFMALQGFVFLILYSVPFWAYIILCYAGFFGLVTLFTVARIRLCST